MKHALMAALVAAGMAGAPASAEAKTPPAVEWRTDIFTHTEHAYRVTKGGYVKTCEARSLCKRASSGRGNALPPLKACSTCRRLLGLPPELPPTAAEPLDETLPMFPTD